MSHFRIEQLEQRYVLAGLDLSQFSLARESDALNGIPNGLGDDWSGVVVHNDSALVVANTSQNTRIERFDLNGIQHLQSISLNNFDDTEAIVTVNSAANRFAVSEERRGNIVQLTLPPAGDGDVEIDWNAVPATDRMHVKYVLEDGRSVSLGDPLNNGLEGLAYDPVNSLFYVATEKTFTRVVDRQIAVVPMGIYRVDPMTASDVGGINTVFATRLEIDFTAVAGLQINDISDIFFRDNLLYVLSEEGGAKLIKVDIATEALVDADDVLTALPIGSEGIAFSADGKELLLVVDEATPDFRRYHVAGDFDATGTIDVGDIDALFAAIRSGNQDSKFDVNADNSVDAADRTTLIKEVFRTFYGDANLDGKFDSGDFVLVFAAGEYEDDVDLNSTWATGDWNGDGDFTTFDIVLAFQDGGYSNQ